MLRTQGNEARGRTVAKEAGGGWSAPLPISRTRTLAPLYCDHPRRHTDGRGRANVTGIECERTGDTMRMGARTTGEGCPICFPRFQNTGFFVLFFSSAHVIRINHYVYQKEESILISPCPLILFSPAAAAPLLAPATESPLPPPHRRCRSGRAPPPGDTCTGLPSSYSAQGCRTRTSDCHSSPPKRHSARGGTYMRTPGTHHSTHTPGT